MNAAPLLFDLARVADSSPSPETALEAWAIDPATGSARGPLAAITRRLRLGLPIYVALEPLRVLFGSDTEHLVTVVGLARDLGAPFAPSVRRLACALEERDRRLAAGAAAAGAARASAKMMAALPVFLFPLGVLGGAPVLDALGASTALLACALGLCGWRWVERLIPVPPRDDHVVTFAALTAAALEGGAGLQEVCDATAHHPSFARARRRTILGMSWPTALGVDQDPALAQVGRVLERCERWGAPAARELEAFAAARRAMLDHVFELALRKAPVRMVAPLVSCALPAFCLVTVVPLLREVGASA